MKVYQISAITIRIKDMEKACSLYSKIPGFKLAHGVKPSDHFTTFEIAKEIKGITTYLNLELINKEQDDRSHSHRKSNLGRGKTGGSEDFGRIIFYTENVDKLYSYMKNDEYISKSIIFESEPTDASWGERFFHIRETNGYQLSFAQPLT
jgi:catechol 2,3-dioxygenase-like lactoylglutathione lyase family enzyme